MLKRPFSVFMVLLLVFAMIPTAFAEVSGQAGVEDAAGTAGTDQEGFADEGEGIVDGDPAENVTFPPQNEDAPDEGKAGGEDIRDGEEQRDGNDDQEAIAAELIVNTGVGYTVVDDEHNYSVSVSALLPYKKSADGKFEILLDGRRPAEWDWEDGVNGLNANASFQVDKPGTHKALVRFQGNVDGKEVTLEAEETVRFPGENYRFEVTYDGKRTFGGKLLGVKDAQGTWFIGVYDHYQEDRLLEEQYSGSITALEYNHTFKGLKPGTYDVMVTFGGELDGVGAGATGILRGVKIKGDGSGEIRDPGKDKPPAVADPDNGEKIIENAKGGKLPNTATNHPHFVLVGGLMLSAGLTLMIRTVKG